MITVDERYKSEIDNIIMINNILVEDISKLIFFNNITFESQPYIKRCGEIVIASGNVVRTDIKESFSLGQKIYFIGDNGCFNHKLYAKTPETLRTDPEVLLKDYVASITPKKKSPKSPPSTHISTEKILNTIKIVCELMKLDEEMFGDLLKKSYIEIKLNQKIKEYCKDEEDYINYKKGYDFLVKLFVKEKRNYLESLNISSKTYKIPVKDLKSLWAFRNATKRHSKSIF